MTIVVINKFEVPKESREEFLKELREHRNFLSGQAGFINGVVFEKENGPSRFNFINYAVWESQKAVDDARQAMSTSYAELKHDPREVHRRLGVIADIGTYSEIEKY